MPYQPLPLAQLITQTQQDISQRLPGSQPGVSETTLNAIAYAQAGLSAQEHEHLAWIARQIIPTEADEAELLKHCSFWGVIRKPGITWRWSRPVDADDRCRGDRRGTTSAQ